MEPPKWRGSPEEKSLVARWSGWKMKTWLFTLIGLVLAACGGNHPLQVGAPTLAQPAPPDGLPSPSTPPVSVPNPTPAFSIPPLPANETVTPVIPPRSSQAPLVPIVAIRSLPQYPVDQNGNPL